MVRRGKTDFYVMAKTAWENALVTRMNGFRTLMDILDTNSINADNASVNEMRKWCQLMYSAHEKARDELKKWR